MDVLIVLYTDAKQTVRSEILDKLAKQADLLVSDDLDGIVRKAQDNQYKMIFLITLKAIPEEWLGKKTRIAVPIITLSNVKELHLVSMISVIEYLKTEPNLSESEGRTNSMFYQSLTFIEENLHRNDLTLEMVATSIFVSRCHYSRMFQKNLGTGFKDYIIKRRIQKAKLMLKNGNSVTDVCFSVGYTDPTHFTRVFRRLVGINPSEYRMVQ